MITRRELIIAFGVCTLAAPLRAFGQQQGNIPRIGLLWINTESTSHYVAAFREGLHAQGYIEGKNIRIYDRSLVDRYELVPEAAGRLVSQKIDVIVCYGATATQTASKATSTIPIVMILGGDPVKLGVVASLSRPGGNITGTSAMTEELNGKRLQILKEIVPRIRRLAVILYPGSTAEVTALREYKATARALDLEVLPVEVRAPSDIGPAIAGIASMDVQAIAVVGSTLLVANSERIVAAVEKIRLPAMYPNTEYPHAGGLLSYAQNTSDRFRRTATYVDKILKGAKPGDIPIEQPTVIELVINMKTAKTLGIKIPNSIMVQATKVIE